MRKWREQGLMRFSEPFTEFVIDAADVSIATRNVANDTAAGNDRASGDIIKGLGEQGRNLRANS